jgi:hypothetical protein
MLASCAGGDALERLDALLAFVLERRRPVFPARHHRADQRPQGQPAVHERGPVARDLGPVEVVDVALGEALEHLLDRAIDEARVVREVLRHLSQAVRRVAVVRRGLAAVVPPQLLVFGAVGRLLLERAVDLPPEPEEVPGERVERAVAALADLGLADDVFGVPAGDAVDLGPREADRSREVILAQQDARQLVRAVAVPVEPGRRVALPQRRRRQHAGVGPTVGVVALREAGTVLFAVDAPGPGGDRVRHRVVGEHHLGPRQVVRGDVAEQREGLVVEGPHDAALVDVEGLGDVVREVAFAGAGPVVPVEHRVHDVAEQGLVGEPAVGEGLVGTRIGFDRCELLLRRVMAAQIDGQPDQLASRVEQHHTVVDLVGCFRDGRLGRACRDDQPSHRPRAEPRASSGAFASRAAPRRRPRSHPLASGGLNAAFGRHSTPPRSSRLFRAKAAGSGGATKPVTNEKSGQIRASCSMPRT